MPERSFIVKIDPEGAEVRARQGELLADVLARNNVPLSLYCYKKGICGKCAVRVTAGQLPALEPHERDPLERRGLGPDWRLACRFAVTGDITVEIPPESRLEKISGLETGVAVPFTPSPRVRKVAVTAARATLEDPVSVADRLAARLEAPGLRLSLAAAQKLGARAEEAIEAQVVLYGDHEILDVEMDGEASADAFGLAVDVGTSTVAAELVDLVSGKSVDRVSALNSQVSYGADVVSRITFAYENPAKLRRVQHAILRQIDDLTEEMARRRGIPGERIYETVIAGNTAMTHFLTGVPVDSLARAPFAAVFAGLPPLGARELGLAALGPTARVYVVPNVKSFVGGDIAAGLAATEFASRPGNALFIDLGTNGEIVLKKGARFVATSTAAGPAFEGMSISCGMLAVPGAVHKAEWQDGAFRLHTIGGGTARGLCGTGLIDVLAHALAQGLINKDGRIVSQEKKLRLNDRLSLGQQDIREVQLAAAAFKTGVRMMLDEFGLRLGDLDAVLVAGAFGSALDIPNSRALGILPGVAEDKTIFVGNASIAGAKKLLLSDPARTAVESLAASIAHVSLAARPEFQDLFVRALELGPYQGGKS